MVKKSTLVFMKKFLIALGIITFVVLSILTITSRLKRQNELDALKRKSIELRNKAFELEDSLADPNGYEQRKILRHIDSLNSAIQSQ